MKAAGRKPNIAIYAAGILFCLTLLSLHITTGLYARYVTSGLASDSAHAATFYLEAKGSLHSRAFLIDDAVPGKKIERDLQIVNKSEVKMRYTLTVQNETKNLPIVFRLIGDDPEEAVSSVNGIVKVEKTLDPGEAADCYVVDVVWKESSAAEDENLPYMGMIDYILITLESEQVD